MSYAAGPPPRHHNDPPSTRLVFQTKGNQSIHFKISITYILFSQIHKIMSIISSSQYVIFRTRRWNRDGISTMHQINQMTQLSRQRLTRARHYDPNTERIIGLMVLKWIYQLPRLWIG